MLYVEYLGERNDYCAEYNRRIIPVINLKSGKKVFEAPTDAAYFYFLSNNPSLRPLVPTPAENTELAKIREAEEAEARENALKERKRLMKSQIDEINARADILEVELTASEAKYIKTKDELKELEKRGKSLSDELADLPETAAKPQAAKKKVKK